MNLYWSVIAQLSEKTSESKPPADDAATDRAASAVSRRVFHHVLTGREKRVAGSAVHFAMGAVSGGLYGLIAERFPRAARDRGVSFGSALWLAGDELAVPALRFSKGPTQYPLNVHAQALGAHVVYAMTTDLLRRVILGRFAAR
jgi:uncharacterized membrane protein YagU involved in acid resistance